MIYNVLQVTLTGKKASRFRRMPCYGSRSPRGVIEGEKYYLGVWAGGYSARNEARVVTGETEWVMTELCSTRVGAYLEFFSRRRPAEMVLCVVAPVFEEPEVLGVWGSGVPNSQRKGGVRE